MDEQKNNQEQLEEIQETPVSEEATPEETIAEEAVAEEMPAEAAEENTAEHFSTFPQKQTAYFRKRYLCSFRKPTENWLLSPG